MTRPDRERFEHLVRTCHAAVFRAARRICADDATAADVTQDVFVRVWEGKVAMEAAVSERATLCWFATRLSQNAGRSARRRHDHEDHAMHRRSEPFADPVATASAADLNAKVATFVDELPEELRLPLLLRHQDELSLAAIGSSLALPTSTVHDRIQLGLERLRSRLQSNGHGLLLAAIPGLLAGFAPAAPGGLERRLLAVSNVLPAVAGLPKVVLSLVAMAVVAIGVAVAAAATRSDAPPTVTTGASLAAFPDAVQDPKAQDPKPTPAAGTEQRRAVPLVPMPKPATEDAAKFTATWTGTVHDASGFPVVGGEVYVVAGGGYKAFELGAPAVTDARGAFTVHASSHWLAPDAVRLVVREHGRQLLDSGDLPLPPAATPRAIELVLPASAGDAVSKYDVTVAVRDEAGAPLAGAKVVFYPGTAGGAAPSLHWRTRSEAQADVDASGRARLQGRGLGDKWLFVDGRPLGHTCVLRALPLRSAGTHNAEVVLPKGKELEVVTTMVDGGEPEGAPWLEHAATDLLLQPKRVGDVWLFRGLADDSYTVRAGDAAVRGVTAARRRVSIQIKESTDVRDVGDHMAELHGEFVDAMTGEVVGYGPFDVELHPLLADGSSLASDGIEPPPPQQRAASGGEQTSFCHTGLTAGRWALVATIEGYAVACVPFELRDREIRASLRVPLHRPAVVHGRVVGSDGQPVAGVTVVALGEGPLADRSLESWRRHRESTQSPNAPEPSFTPLRSYTRDAGAFTMLTVPPDVPLRLVAMHDTAGFCVLTVPPLRAGETVGNLVLKLAPR